MVANWATLLTAITAGVGLLAYIARLVWRGLRTLDRLAEMPEAHAQLVTRTEQNTEAIDHLTREVAWLRAAMTMGRGRR